MTPEQTLDKYRSIVSINSQRAALELSLELKKKSLGEQRNCFGGDYHSGFFWLFRMDQHPDRVMECVVSPAGDAITSVYKNDPFNASVGEVMKMRQELIAAIANKIGLSVEAIGIDDPGRGRALGLNECATGQLIDMLAERMGVSVGVTSSMGGNLDQVVLPA